MTSAQPTVVLAYSGGLDTTCILVWLREQGYSVVTFFADLGQGDDPDEVRSNAIKLGAKKVVIKDLRQEFVTDFVWPAVMSGAIYEDRYLMGTALARPLIARAMIQAAAEEGARYVAHGATGKGNDQVRFDLAFYALSPDIQVIAPWRQPEFYNRFKGRQDLIKYAKEHNFQVPATPKAPWSIDANLMHTSYESGILEDPNTPPPLELFKRTRDPTDTPDKPALLDIEFKEGIPVKIHYGGKETTEPLKMLELLNQVGGEHGVGRVDLVENRMVGMKSRGVYETPGVTVLYHAHLDLECLTMDREVRRIKQFLATRFSEQVYGGLWYSPECDYTRQCLQISQKLVTGTVHLKLTKGNVVVLGRSSPISLYNQDLVSMDIPGDYTPADAEGFIKISAVRLKEYMRVKSSSGNI